MRIVVFSELLYPHGGGAELATWLHLKLLSEEGFEPIVITSQLSEDISIEIDNRMTIFRVPLRMVTGGRYDGLFNLGILASSFIRKLVKESDVIYIPGGWYSVIPFAKIYKKPVIVHFHNYSIICSTSLMYDFVNKKVGSSSLKSFMLHEIIERRRDPLSAFYSSIMNELFGKYYNRLGMFADALIFVSNAQMNLVISKLPWLKENSYMIYNPIPELPFIKAERKGVGFFGGRSLVKGLYVLIDVLKSIDHQTVKNVYMAKLINNYKITKINGIQINLLPKINTHGFLDLMKNLSVVAIPSICPEPLPYILIESMLYGKLIVASDIGGISEIVTGSNLGVKLTEPGNCKEIVDALTYFLDLNIDEINEIGWKNREYVLRKFDNKKISASLINILEKITK